MISIDPMNTHSCKLGGFITLPIVFIPFLCLAADSQTVIVDFSPQKVFTRESTAVQIFVSARDPKVTLKRVQLQRLDDSRNSIEDMGDLYDGGKFGDIKAGDGKFGRKIEFTEKKKKHVLFLVSAETSEGKVEVPIEIQVIQRPSFVETLELIWIRRDLKKQREELKSEDAFLSYVRSRPDVERVVANSENRLLIDFKNGTQIEF